MAPFDILTKMFRSGLATPLEAETTNVLQLINIELEELDHDGRRSTEKTRRRYVIKPVVVRLQSFHKAAY